MNDWRNKKKKVLRLVSLLWLQQFPIW